jgi:hyperosmotically inducible protein
MKLSVIVAAALLAIGPVAGTMLAQSAPATQTKPSDQELSKLIATKIANDASLSADAIKVKVEGGVVTLSGIVGKDADKAAAEELARVPGVVRVENKLTSREKATDKVKDTAAVVADTSKKGAAKTKKAVTKTGEAITDGWITSRVKGNFAGDDALRGSDINVDTNDHVVTLTGVVPTAAARTTAIALAKKVEGVKRVVDNLKIAGQDR